MGSNHHFDCECLLPLTLPASPAAAANSSESQDSTYYTLATLPVGSHGPHTRDTEGIKKEGREKTVRVYHLHRYDIPATHETVSWSSTKSLSLSTVCQTSQAAAGSAPKTFWMKVQESSPTISIFSLSEARPCLQVASKIVLFMLSSESRVRTVADRLCSWIAWRDRSFVLVTYGSSATKSNRPAI